MGRREQRERERKRAASICQSLEKFLPKKKKASDSAVNDNEHYETDDSVYVSGVTEAKCTDDDGDGDGSDNEVESIAYTRVDAATCVEGTVSSSEDAATEGTSCELPVDIGEIYTRSKTASEFSKAMHTLNSAQKYNLLKNHRKPRGDYVFPTTYLGGCNRSFRHPWLMEHPWLVYSEVVDGAFCNVCSVFCADTSKGNFVVQPFRLWHKKGEKFKAHERSAYHQHALQQADLLKQSVEKPHTTITVQVDARKVANIQRNRVVLKSIASAILYCGKQCIALRGSSENLDSPGNPGNFLALLKLLSMHDEELRKHLEAPAMRCVTHLSPQTQNELITVMGKHMILQGILNELNSSKFYAILADEVTSHNLEVLAICARFVDQHKDIREEFLGFLELERITGEKVAESILGFLKENGIPVVNMRGQGYDGASNMSSPQVGVQGRIKQVAPLATYVHCSGHCLNLVISKSCAQPQVRNMLDRLRNCCRYFLNSPKRNGALEMIVRQNVVDTEKRKALLDLCKTRWAERHYAYQHFYQAYVFIVEALEMIGFKHHLEKYGRLYADWDSASRSDAQQVLGSITSFEFIIVFVSIYQHLSHLAGITVKLQKQASDIIKAHQMILEVADTYKHQRTDVDNNFHLIFTQSIRMADKVGATVMMPRIASRQQHRNNTEAHDPEQYYKRTIAIPLLDHIIASIEKQFSQHTTIATSLLGLVPSVFCSESEASLDIESVVSMYETDLHSPELLEMELARWKRRYKSRPEEKRPTTPASAIKDCDKESFPNIFVLLQIACTLPVTSCECERSASTLRRLNNYLRASMGKSRMSHLALLHMHYDTPVDLEEVVNTYAKIHPRRLELDCLF